MFVASSAIFVTYPDLAIVKTCQGCNEIPRTFGIALIQMETRLHVDKNLQGTKLEARIDLSYQSCRYRQTIGMLSQLLKTRLWLART